MIFTHFANTGCYFFKNICSVPAACWWWYLPLNIRWFKNVCSMVKILTQRLMQSLRTYNRSSSIRSVDHLDRRQRFCPLEQDLRKKGRQIREIRSLTNIKMYPKKKIMILAKANPRSTFLLGQFTDYWTISSQKKLNLLLYLFCYLLKWFALEFSESQCTTKLLHSVKYHTLVSSFCST